MRLSEFQNVILKLANQTMVRYWLWWGYPNPNAEFALVIKECDIQTIEYLTKKGFRILYHTEEGCYFTIGRHNEDGTPFISKL